MKGLSMFEKLKGSIWVNGDMIPCEQAQIHIVSHGLHYASSVFEGIRAYGGKIFKGKEHYERFQKSANYLNFDVPFDVQTLMDATEKLLEKNNLENAYIRPVAWCGTRSMKISTNDMDVSMAIAAWNWETKPYTHDGISLVVSSWRRPDPRSAPVQSKAAGLYMISSLAKSDSEKQNFDDALMLDCAGNIAESTVSNVFFVKAGVLYTPIPESFLNGITRLTVIDIAKSLNVEVIETVIPLSSLDDFQECFLTGTALEIRSVGKITGHEDVWTFDDRTITTKIWEKFYQMTRQDERSS